MELQKVLNTFEQQWIHEVTMHGVDNNENLKQRFEQLCAATKQMLHNSSRHREYESEEHTTTTNHGSPHSSEEDKTTKELTMGIDTMRALCYDI